METIGDRDVSAVHVWLGSGLAAAREHLGMSLRELAAELGHSHTAVRAWERNRVPAAREAAVERVLRTLDVLPVAAADVRLLRRRLRLSQSELAARLRVSKALVSGWEQGATIRPEHAAKLRRELDSAPSLTRAVRDWHGWTNEELARELNVSTARVTQWEQGDPVARKYADRLAELAEAEPLPPAAQELAAWRARRRLSRGEVARRVGVTRARVGEWEAGVAIPARYRGPLRRAMRARLASAPYEERALELIRASPGRCTVTQIARLLERAGAARIAVAALLERGAIEERPGIYEDMHHQQRLGLVLYPAGAGARSTDVPTRRVSGEELRSLRLAPGKEVSGARLARRLGVSRRAVRHWEGLDLVSGWRAEQVMRALYQLRHEPAPERPTALSALAGDELRKRRIALGLTQAWLGELAGLSGAQARVSAWERGSVRVTEAAATRIEAALAAAAGERVTGDELRSARLDSGWKREELAGRLGVTLGRVGRWESGRTPVPCALWGRIRSVLESAPRVGRATPMPHLRERRGRLRWSQRELAERLGVSGSLVSTWERGASIPPALRESLERELGSGVPATEPGAARRDAIVALVTQEPGVSPKQVSDRVRGAWRDVRSDLDALEASGLLHARATRYFNNSRSHQRPPTRLYPGVAPASPMPLVAADEIVRRRQQLIWSQAELARRLGVDQSMLWRWEHGVTEPDAEQVAMLGEVLTAAEQEFAAVDRDRLARIETLLHATRERLAFSRSEMARRLGVDRDTYVAWEDRRRPVSSGRRRGVLAALDQLEAAASAAGEPAPAA